MTSKSLTLVLGGARSGKSRYAQELATGFDEVVFLATAQPSDPEMKAKIDTEQGKQIYARRLGMVEPAVVSLSDVSIRPRQNLRGFAVEV